MKKEHLHNADSSTEQAPKRQAEEVKKPKSKKKIVLIVLLAVVALILTLILCGYLYIRSILGHANYEALDPNDLGISSSQTTQTPSADGSASSADALPTAPVELGDVTNILLCGVDSRDMDKTSGRSDAMMILTIDKVHNSIKLTSLARDTRVAVEGHSQTKLTHAYAYGGAQLAVKTVNQNFNMNIQDVVSVNFGQLASIIDYLGGVTIDVDAEEMEVMRFYVEELNGMGIPTDYVTEPGVQTLTGGQAVAYARNRYTGSDITRMERQREVLHAMMDKAMTLKVTQYPEFLSMVLSQCTTSLSQDEMLSMGLWAVASRPDFQQMVLPNDRCNARGEMINGGWFFVYDLDTASKELHNFIYEPES